MAKLANTTKVLGGVVVAIDRERQKAVVALVGQDELFELPLEKYGKPVFGERSWSLQPDEVRQKLGTGTHIFASISGVQIGCWCTRDRFAEVASALTPRQRDCIERPHFSKHAARTLMGNFEEAAKAMLKPTQTAEAVAA